VNDVFNVLLSEVYLKPSLLQPGCGSCN